MGVVGAVIFFLVIIGVPVGIAIANYNKHQNKQAAFVESGAMTDRHRRAFADSLAGVKLTAKHANLKLIYEDLDKAFLAAQGIAPKTDFGAGLIEFETKYLVGASFSYVKQEGDMGVFMFRVAGRGNYTGSTERPEETCNIILTALEKAIAKASSTSGSAQAN